MNICELCADPGARQYDPTPSRSIGGKVVEMMAGPADSTHLHPDCLALLRSGELAPIARSILDLQEATTKAENEAQAANDRQARTARDAAALSSKLAEAKSTITELQDRVDARTDV